MPKKKGFLKNLATSFRTVVGLVLVWRGVWYVLDYIDLTFLRDEHVYTAIGGIVLGLALLYLPDKDFKEIEKL